MTCDNPLYSVETSLLCLKRSLNDMMYGIDMLLQEIRRLDASTVQPTLTETEIPPLPLTWAEVFTTASPADSAETDTTSCTNSKEPKPRKSTSFYGLVQ